MMAAARFEHLSVSMPAFRIELIEHTLATCRPCAHVPSSTHSTTSTSASRASMSSAGEMHARPLFSPPLLVASPRYVRPLATGSWSPLPSTSTRVLHVRARRLLGVRIGGVRVSAWRCADRSIDDPRAAWQQARFAVKRTHVFKTCIRCSRSALSPRRQGVFTYAHPALIGSRSLQSPCNVASAALVSRRAVATIHRDPRKS